MDLGKNCESRSEMTGLGTVDLEASENAVISFGASRTAVHYS